MTSEYSVKVNKVPQGTTPDELRAVFEAAGFIHGHHDVYLPEKFAKFEFGFVRFGNIDEAQRAADAYGLSVRGTLLSCELAVNDKRRVGASAPAAAGRAAPAGRGGSGGLSGAFGAPAGSVRGALEAPRPPEEAGAQDDAEHSVWVGSLPPGATTDQLRAAFASRGVDSMTDVYLPPGRDYGFVRFRGFAEADRAMQACSRLEVGGSPVELKLSTTAKRSVGQPRL
eukprot:CAMPEP_0175498844 /NCGR_PEP_ID=MMETSP0096-20121207/5520_1 /TAXON_ID=311494 /ORGANISM="Alexandrium monilatum, Strain CCMP3105" /LENGTH=225 /DNA_ID=CAMNT_0016800877 /DNA_START=31 /DNA_END=706 /DNA_ORIENTATION=+